jgi:amylovoran biosynthesis glycosyltransferase AmsE
MLAKGMKLENIPEVLVDMRLGENFAARRGGKSYFAQYRKLRRMQKDLGYTSETEYLKGLAATWVMTRMPQNLRSAAYRRLRKQ